MTNETEKCHDSLNKSAFCLPEISVGDFLNLNSLENHNEFCLAYTFTYREFAKSTLGLSWIGKPSGIYFSKITLNVFFFIFNFLDNCLTGHFIKKHNPWYCWMKHPEILYVFLYYKNIDVDCSIYLKGFFGGIFTYASVW